MITRRKNIDFIETVEEGVALVGLISRLYAVLDQFGAGTQLKAASSASAKHVDLIRLWQGQAMATRNPEGIYALFASCRDIINPVQSGLQNLVRTGEWRSLVPAQADTPDPDQLLRAIVRAKEDWAYIDAHPQIVIRR